MLSQRRGGRWRRSARGRSRLGCGVEDAAMGRRADAAGGSPCGRSRACRGAPDAARAGDAERPADRHRRRPWWSVAAIRARPRTPRLRGSKMRPWADARPRLAACHAVAAERAAALRTRRAPEMRKDPRIAPGGGRGVRWRRSARASAARVDRVIGSCSGRTRGRGWWRTTRSQLGAPRCYGRSVRRRYP